MAIALTTKEKRWIKNVFMFLNNIPDPDNTVQSVTEFNDSVAKGHMYCAASYPILIRVWKAAHTIMEELDRRRFVDIDDAIEDLTWNNQIKYFDKDANDYLPMSFNEAADALAAMCVLNNLFWVPDKYTQYEIDYFNKTAFGISLNKALAAQFGSAPNQTSQNTTQAQNSASTSKSVNVQGTSPTGPHANITTAGNYIKPNSVHSRPIKTKTPGVVNSTYKQSGPQSQNAFDLKSTPGQKVTMTGDQGYIFCITAQDNIKSKNRPLVYVNPLINTSKYRTATTNKVKFDSAHGYSDLTLYFNTPAEATAFAQKLIAANLVPSKLSNVEIAKRSFSQFSKQFSHGFYEIGTELGNAFVCAYKLNEALAQENSEELDEEMSSESLTVEQNDKTQEEYLEDIRKARRELSWD